MASEELSLTIVFSPTATDDLDAIWRWNAERYTVSHADAYLRFINDRIATLAENYAKGRRVPSRTDLRYILIKRKSKGHGHIAVYRYDDVEVHVLHLFHTAQDWQNAIGEQ
jgi:plasmid stabilization system protein ParE